MWLFKYKFQLDGSLSRYKARLVANGRNQQHGIDCDETFTPVVKLATIRTILSLVVSRDWLIHQLDAKNAFLHGYLSDTFQRFASFATRIGFQHSKTDTSLFIFHHGSDIAYLLLYVDDIILTASSVVLLHRIIDTLHSEFAMIDLGSLNYFLGIFAQRTASGMFLSQSKFAEEILERAHILAANALKRIMRYVRGTVDYGLQLHVSFTTQLTAYTDVDWAGCPVTLSRSSAEAEYHGVANVVAETAWIHNFFRELHTSLFIATLVYRDNVSAVYMSANPVQHQRTKHIEIDIHFVRDFVAKGHVRVLHVPSRFQYADIFTKGLHVVLFLEFRSSLNVRRPPISTTGGVLALSIRYNSPNPNVGEYPKGFGAIRIDQERSSCVLVLVPIKVIMESKRNT
ncbi:ribonuclease H-like domain-containing protein [Tanacetum coccineum]